MAGRTIPSATLFLGVLLAVTPCTRAQEQWREAPRLTERAANVAPGICTDRLSPGQLRAWKAIEGIVFAKDGSGRLRHPKLHSLWQWAETSGHVIYVELPDPKARGNHQAGKFMIEKSDPAGRKHVAAIRLCLAVIDRALVRKRIQGVDSFIRFEGLDKERRYAEILGHELAHAVWTLSDRSHVRLTEDLDAEVKEFDSLRRYAGHGGDWDRHAKQHLRVIQSLVTRIEKPAETAEVEVWQELRHRNR